MTVMHQDRSGLSFADLSLATIQRVSLFDVPTSRDLNNTYIFLRHGHAETNARGVLASSCESEVGRLGLTTDGIRQARLVGVELASLISDSQVREFLTLEQIKIISSPLTRARETARIIANTFEAEWSHFSAAELKSFTIEELRERQWGADLDGKPVELWRNVRDADLHGEQFQSAEGLNAFLGRVAQLFHEAEKGIDQVYICVTHCDVIQAAQLLTAMDPTAVTHYSEAGETQTGKFIILGKKI